MWVVFKRVLLKVINMLGPGLGGNEKRGSRGGPGFGGMGGGHMRDHTIDRKDRIAADKESHNRFLEKKAAEEVKAAELARIRARERAIEQSGPWCEFNEHGECTMCGRILQEGMRVLGSPQYPQGKWRCLGRQHKVATILAGGAKGEKLRM